MKKRVSLMPILMAIMMAFTMIPMIGGTAYASSEVKINGIIYTLNDDNTATVSGHTDEHPANVVFPEKVEGHTVTGIGDYVFDNYKGNLTSISIPKTVTSIGEYSFFDTGISSVSIDENSELTYIGYGAFQSCGNLKSITIPKKVKNIEGGAFKMTGLETIIFEDGSELTEIGTYAFENCSSLTSITIPSSVTSIGYDVFSGCNALNTVYYEGTEEQWNAMPKRDGNWAKGWEGEVVFLDINSYDVSFDDQYLVEEDDPFTPYTEYFYVVPAGTDLNPIVSKGEITLDSECYKASYSEMAYNEEEHNYNIIDENDWQEEFPTEPGVYICGVEGVSPYYGDYEGIIHLIRIIDLKDIGNYEVSFDDEYLVEDDDPVTPYPEFFYDVPAGTTLDPVVERGDTILDPDCYNVSYSEVYFNEEKYEYNIIDENVWQEEFPTKLGIYFCKVEGKDPYYGSFEWIPLIRITTDISKDKVELSEATFVYNGKVQKPSVKTVGGKTLKEGKDYTVSWSNASSKNAGTYTVTVQGKGIYAGTTKATYTITKATVKVTAPVSKTFTYNGKTQTGVVAGSNYTLSGTTKATNAGTYTAKATLKTDPNYAYVWADGTTAVKYITWKINKAVAKVTVPKGKTFTYNGKTKAGVAAGSNYILSGTVNATKAGTYTAKATLKTNSNYTYKWSDGTSTAKSIKWTINKAANPLTIKAKTATVKYSAVKNKAQTLVVGKVITFTKKGQGKLTYTWVSGNKSITINKTTGKVTVKKGLKKGTYNVKVKVKAAGNANYKASAWKTVTFKVVVK